jgi:hypothetical protein
MVANLPVPRGFENINSTISSGMGVIGPAVRAHRTTGLNFARRFGISVWIDKCIEEELMARPTDASQLELRFRNAAG